MADNLKAKSPFYPGQPVPPELFVGRSDAVKYILDRGAGQVQAGKPVTLFIEGEYGIGKSSLANYLLTVASQRWNLHGVYAQLGGVKTLEGVAQHILEAVLSSGAYQPTRSEAIRNLLAKYIGDQQIYGLFDVKLESLKVDLPRFATPHGLLQLLRETQKRLSELGSKGIFLVLDEINGIADNADFAQFVKGLVDNNAVSQGTQPVPLLLALCGVSERREQMIASHPPIDRVMDVVEIKSLSRSEMSEFFSRAFSQADMTVDADAMELMCRFSAGLPKIMHEIGDGVYWRDDEGRVSLSDAVFGCYSAAQAIGRKYVATQVIKELQSEAYQQILHALASIGPEHMEFTRGDLLAKLPPDQSAKLDNFLRRMRDLGVIRQRVNKGEYAFINPMVRLYLWINSAAHGVPGATS